jgi:anthraniloyl-CoA monooxygenase
MTSLGERPLKTVVVGGGPGGLLYAALAKRRFPQHEIVVHERNPPDATFGFGVVFSERTLSGFADADPELHATIAQASVTWEDIEVRRDGTRMRCGGHGFSAISRKRLLALLQERAQSAGVDLRFESEVDASIADGADLVLAADGVNSVLRNAREAAFQPSFEVGAARYIWFATPQSFDALTFIFLENEHGSWAVHAYPFEDGTSTFIVETDEETWRRAGLDGATDLPPGESDMRSLEYCEQLFAEHLGGHRLLENNSKWLQFRTLRCASWWDGNVALIGDSAHTAHFSVGSGTKMAMEDAVALADAIGSAPTVASGLAAYTAARRPEVDHIQNAAAPSLVWWERFRHLEARSDEEFAFHFLSRSPRVTRGRLKGRDYRFVRRVEQAFAVANGASLSDGPVAAPFRHGSLELANRLVVVPPAHLDPLPALGGAAIAGAGLVVAAPGEGLGPALRWIRENSATRVALSLPADASMAEIREAAATGFDALIIDADAPNLDAWPLDRALIAAVPAVADSEGPDGDLLVQRAEALCGRLALIGVRAPEERLDDPLGAQLMVCDRIKQETGLPTVLLEGVADLDTAATAILAGRADLVAGRPLLASERWQPEAADEGAALASVVSPA